MGTNIETSFASEITLPIIKPSAFPTNPVSITIKQNMKNCSAVLANPIIQYMIAAQRMGIRIIVGSSTRFLERKKVKVPYSLDPSSFKNMTLSFGKMMETGDKVVIRALIARKKKRPDRV